MRAVCYPRVSSPTQRERHTIASQLRLLPEFVARMGWTLVKPVDTYIDDGFTAKAGKLAARRGFEALMRDAVAGQFDVVVLITFDRLTRSEDLAERGMILGGLQRAGVKVADAMSGMVLDFSTDMGDLMGSLQAVWASIERRKIREKTMQGKVTAALKNKKPQGPTPFGLKYDRDTGEWSIDPVRGPIMREIVERIAGGESAGAIAADLNARKAPAPRAFWERSRIYCLTKSKHTLGEWVANRGRGIVVKVPPIVDLELWERAQEALVANRARPLMAHTKHVYLLERMATCSACGSTITIRAAAPGRKIAARYLCRRRRELVHDGIRCSAPTVDIADADARVWEQVRKVLVDPKLGEKLLASRSRGLDDQRSWKDDVASYRKHLARLDTNEAAIVARFNKGLISEKTMDQTLRAQKRERDAVVAQLKAAERYAKDSAAAIAETETLGSMLEQLRELAQTATATERRELVRRFVVPGSVTFVGTEIRFKLWIPATVSEQRSSTWTHHGDGLQIRMVA